MSNVVCLASYREQKLREEVEELMEYVDWLLEPVDTTPEPYYVPLNWSELYVPTNNMDLETYRI